MVLLIMGPIGRDTLGLMRSANVQFFDQQMQQLTTLYEIGTRRPRQHRLPPSSPKSPIGTLRPEQPGR